MKKIFKSLIVIAVIGAGMTSCTVDPNSPGVEYMPDMFRSPAIEAYVDNGQDPYLIGEEKAEEQRTTPSVRKPVKGTIAYNAVNAEYSMPYAYPNDYDGYLAASAELKSPLATSQENIDAGNVLFVRMCDHCHGDQGAGDGKISENGFIMGIPDFATKLKDTPVGAMYHTLMFGKGLMGSHAGQLSVEERWQVIQYVQVLQNGGAMPEFGANGEAAVEEAELTDEAAEENSENAEV